MNNNFPKGSEWRKWDLQVQTILDDGYVSIGSYIEEIRTSSPDKLAQLVTAIGSEELVIKYDSKEYFANNTNGTEKQRAENYAKLFVNYIEIFNKDVGGVCITDHNYDHPQLIDALVKESKSTRLSVFAGVEINVEGVHLLVVFGKYAYNKTSFSETIKTFLTKLDIHSRKKDGVLTVCSKSYQEVIDEVTKIEGIIIYPHCNSTNGLFQERGKTDRTHLQDYFNYQKVNVLQSQTSSSNNQTEQYIKSKTEFKSGYIFTLGSDSRCLRDILQPDSDGNYCWIKADTTFLGLKQIIYEKERVFIGVKPNVIERVSSAKTKYIQSLSVNQIDGYGEEQGIWFKETEIPLNSELVAIIGNKGSGKSAIADIIGLLGDTKQSEHFSFLNTDKFLRRGYAENFSAQLGWEDGLESEYVSLSNQVDSTRVERVRYLPQNYFETITNSLNSDNFEKSLRAVIFQNIPDPDRLGLSSFEDLEKTQKKNIEHDLERLKSELSQIIEKIVALEKKQHPDFINKLKNSIIEKEKELSEHEKIKPTEVIDPNKNIAKSDSFKDKQASELTTLNDQYAQVVKDIDEKTQNLIKLKQNEAQLTTVSGAFDRFKEQYTTLKEEYKDILLESGIEVDKLFKLKVKLEPITEKLNSIALEIRSAELSLSPDSKIDSDIQLTAEEKVQYKKSSLATQKSEIKKKIDAIKLALSKPEKDFQEYKEKLGKWEIKKKEIEGIADNPEIGTLAALKKMDVYITTQLETEHTALLTERINKTKDIFSKKNEILTLYNTLKQSIDQQLSDRADLAEKFKIEISSGFDLEKGFPSAFLGYIHKSRSGTFRAASEPKVLELFKDKSLTSIEDLQAVLDNIILLLNEDHGEHIEKEKNKRYISDQIASIQEFYEYIFSLDYLLPVYDLRLDGKKLEELSPGERGALLLVFYLIIDKEDIPLVIDQPEDNLDNKSVYEILTHFIKLAKSRRQIIIVTHNPNLAVGADAEQIIYVEIEKKNKCKFTYESGAIENPTINNRIVEILEGTMPAFQKRELKYLKLATS